jgi:hypothetical protein
MNSIGTNPNAKQCPRAPALPEHHADDDLSDANQQKRHKQGHCRFKADILERPLAIRRKAHESPDEAAIGEEPNGIDARQPESKAEDPSQHRR